MQDTEIEKIINKEQDRQLKSIELIASENFVSKQVMDAQGSVLTNKYAEGYPGKRYYGGCGYIDEAENLAIERIKKLFNAEYANVQPHSGSQANLAVFFSLLSPGDTILGMSLSSGGHLSHGALPNISGKWFNSVAYGVSKETHLIDLSEVESLAIKHKPKLIIAGCSAYSRKVDFEGFRKIADKVGAFLLADVAHIAGLIVTGFHDNPINHAHIVTSTTHKTLRGPRGGIILTNDLKLSKQINSSIFPGLQGGPLMHVIAAKAIAFKEALSDDFRNYMKQVIKNAQTLSKTLIERGYDIVTGGTDNHIVLVNLSRKNITGKDSESFLESIGITCNKNTIPFDLKSPFITSGIRLGTAACTTRGFKENEFQITGNLIADSLDMLSQNTNDIDAQKSIINKVQNLCKKFKLYEM